MKVLLASYIFDGERLLKDAAVVVNGSVVVDVGGFKRILKSYNDVDKVDLDKSLLFPGFVNTHTHLELGYLNGRIDSGKGFVEWLKSIMMLKEDDESLIDNCIEDGIKELLQGGVALVGDISNTLLSVPYLEKLMPRSVVFYETYSLNKERACKIIKDLKSFKNSSKRVDIKITPHAIYSTHPCLLEFICSKNRELVSLHFLESVFEKEFLAGKGYLFDFLKEASLVDYNYEFKNVWGFLEKLGCLIKGMIFVHCVDVSKKDIEKIKDVGATVCLCLRSNKFISGQLPPVYSFAESGINISIGTDSLASNWNLNFLEEMSFIKNNFPSLKSEDIFRWSINGGAKALKVNIGFYRNAYAKPFFVPISTNSPLDEILEKGAKAPIESVNV